MAAPSGTVWGSIVGGYGRIGIYSSISSSNTSSTVTVEVWFWSKYSVSDTSNTYYYDNLSTAGSATTSKGSVSINTSVDSGSGWSTSNQQRLGSYSYTYTRGTSAVTRYLRAKLVNVDRIGGTMTAAASVSIPKLASYTVSYNANGGSGAPSSQTKWYGKNLTLSSTKPTRTGYTFQGWATSSGGSVVYSSGSSYTSNTSVTLYAVWKAITYSVKYNANGGSGAPSNQTKTYGVTLTLSSTKPTKTNYTFKGWGTSASSTTVAYASGASYTKNAAITLYAVWALSYSKPKITSYSVNRCNSSGTVTDEGTYGLVKFAWSTSKSVTNILIEWESGSGGSGSTTVTASGTSGNVSTVIGSGSLTTESTYTIRVTVTDSGGSYTLTRSLAGIKFPLDLLNGGTGIAFGKPAELSNYADIAYKTKHRASIEFDNNQVIYGFKSDGTICEAINPQNVNGNTVIGYGNYDQKSGGTHIYGYDIMFGISNIATPGTYKPYLRRGDSFTVTFRTAGYITNACKDLSFWLPLTVPIVGSPTITVTSVDGFVLRQGNNYTHGSGASTFITPTSYEATNYYRCGIYIKAVFSNITNAINNNAIGVYWNGTITLT